MIRHVGDHDRGTATGGASGTPESLDGLRVFLAEDDPTILFMLEATVDSFGCNVVGTAMRVDNALAFIQSNDIDVAVIDVALADGDCAPLVTALAVLGTPVILATGAASSVHAQGPKGAIFLRKPFTDRDLRAALAKAAGRPPE